MGEILMRYYNWIGEQGELSAQMQLAMETKMAAPKAALAPDSEENIRLFKNAIAKITGKKAPDFTK